MRNVSLKLFTILSTASTILLVPTTVLADDSSPLDTISQGKISLTPGTTATSPFTPGLDPAGITNNLGPLSVDYLTPLDFGTDELAGGIISYTSTVSPTIQVTDTRGSGAGWDLSVKASAFVGTADPTHTLRAAQFSFPAGEITSADSTNPTIPVGLGAFVVNADNNSAPTSVFNAQDNQGMGSFAESFKQADVKLTVMAGAYKDSYSTTLTWTLASTPKLIPILPHK